MMKLSRLTPHGIISYFGMQHTGKSKDQHVPLNTTPIVIGLGQSNIGSTWNNFSRPDSNQISNVSADASTTEVTETEEQPDSSQISNGSADASTTE